MEVRPIAYTGNADTSDGRARQVARTACPTYLSSCMRVHLKRCKGVAPASVPITRKKKAGAARLASVKRVQETIVAVVASSSSSSPKRIHFARGESKA